MLYFTTYSFSFIHFLFNVATFAGYKIWLIHVLLVSHDNG